MRTFVGLDCGGTTSRVLAVDETGEAVFRGQSGPANLLATPESAIVRNLRRAVDGCPPATAVCGAFAGLIGPDEHRRALELLADLFPGAELRAEADYAAAHAAAPAGTDVTVIAGTGSLVCGLDGSGKLVKTGIGGYLLGDEGSGYRFGRAALIQFLRSPEEATPGLGDAVEALFGTRLVAEIVAAVHKAPAPQALLARLLLAFARDIDAEAPYATTVAAHEEAELAETVALHSERHGGDDPILRIALTGGVWKASPRFEQFFRLALQTRLEGRTVRIDPILRPPVQGAVALAKEVRR